MVIGVVLIAWATDVPCLAHESPNLLRFILRLPPFESQLPLYWKSREFGSPWSYTKVLQRRGAGIILTQGQLHPNGTANFVQCFRARPTRTPRLFRARSSRSSWSKLFQCVSAYSGRETPRLSRTPRQVARAQNGIAAPVEELVHALFKLPRRSRRARRAVCDATAGARMFSCRARRDPCIQASARPWEYPHRSRCRSSRTNGANRDV